MKQKIDLSIVICNYNTAALLKQTLTSVFIDLTGIEKEVIVVDDNSTDLSATMVKKDFPEVVLIQNKRNFGYAKSCNIGTKKAEGRYILQLNSDVTFKKGTNIKKLIDYMEAHPKVGIAGCKLLELDTKLDLTCKHSFPTIQNIFYQSIGLTILFPKSRIFGDYYLTYLDEDEINEVDCLGAFMLLRRQVIETVGFMDEQYFIYGEDIDYCFRTKQKGWKILYYPKIVGVHHHGATTKKRKLKSLYYFHRAMFIYYRKHIAATNSHLVNMLVYCGIAGRFGFFAGYHGLKNLLSKVF